VLKVVGQLLNELEKILKVHQRHALWSEVDYELHRERQLDKRRGEKQKGDIGRSSDQLINPDAAAFGGRCSK
jgi:hypothetical protein